MAEVIAIVAGAPQAAQSLSFSIRNFGRPRNGAAVRYEMQVEAEDFVARFRPIYDECMEELQREDALMESFEPLYAGATRYPTLDQFFALAPGERMQIVATHFTFDLLRLYLVEEAPRVRARWSLVSLDDLCCNGGLVRMRGRAIPR